MKTFPLTLALLLSAAAGYAQTADLNPGQLPAIEFKALNLQYIGKDSTSVLERIGYDELGKSSRQQPSVAGVPADAKAAPRLKYKMPIMRPDPAIDLLLLAIKPDSSIHYHLLIKGPE